MKREQKAIMYGSMMAMVISTVGLVLIGSLYINGKNSCQEVQQQVHVEPADINIQNNRVISQEPQVKAVLVQSTEGTATTARTVAEIDAIRDAHIEKYGDPTDLYKALGGF